jgi:hypothetical protein
MTLFLSPQCGNIQRLLFDLRPHTDVPFPVRNRRSVYHIIMMLFFCGKRIKQLFELRVLSLTGIVFIFNDTNFFLAFIIIQ